MNLRLLAFCLIEFSLVLSQCPLVLGQSPKVRANRNSRTT